MKKLTILLVLSWLTIASGCANGPIRQFFKGGACNSCNPPFGLFKKGEHTVGTCSNGVCGGVAPIDGTMMGGAEFGSGITNPPTDGADGYPYPGTTNGLGGNPGTLGGVLNQGTTAPSPSPAGGRQ